MQHRRRQSSRRRSPGVCALRIEALDARVLLSAVAWVGTSGDWSNPNNWSTGMVPGAADDVTILAGADYVITHSTGDDTVQSLYTEAALIISGGAIHITGASAFNNSVTVTSNTPDKPEQPGGTLDIASGSLVVNGGLELDGPGALRVGPTAVVNLYAGIFSFIQDPARFQILGTVNVQTGALPRAPLPIEVMSADLGATSAGFDNNFAYHILSLGDDGGVVLFNEARNSSVSTGDEALYVDTLILKPGSTLDLNGFHVYARNFQGDPGATILNGSVIVVPTVESSRVIGNPVTNARTVQFLVSFNEPLMGVTASSFTLVSGPGISGAHVTNVVQSGADYTVTVDTGAGGAGDPVADTLRLDVNALATMIDASGNSLTAGFTSGEEFVIDRTTPTVLSSTIVGPASTTASIVQFTVTFSDPIVVLGNTPFVVTTGSGITGAHVVGVVPADPRVPNVFLVSVDTGAGGSGGPNDTIRLDVLASTDIQDFAGNPLQASFTTGQKYTITKISLDPIADVTVAQNSGPTTIALTGIGGAVIVVTAASNNPAIVGNPSVNFLPVPAPLQQSGSITLAPQPGQTGTTVVTVTVTDGVSVFSRSFQVTVAPPLPASKFNSATSIPIPTNGALEFTGNLTTANATYLVFVAPFTGVLGFSVGAQATTGTYLSVYDQNQRLLQIGTQPNAATAVNVVSGQTYYVTIRAAGATSGVYDYLTQRLDTGTGHQFSDATLIDPFTGNVIIDATLGTAGVDDYYKFRALASGLVTVTQTGAPALDSFLAAYDSNQNLITENDDVAPGLNTDSQIKFNVTAGSDYYLRASGFAGSTGNYVLTAVETPVSGYGYTFDDAVQLPLDGSGNTTFSGQLEAGDVQYFQFTATVSGHATISLTPDSGSSANLLRVYDGSPTQIASTRQTMTNHVQIDVVAGQLYYLQVSSSVTAGAGGYQLRSVVAPAAVDVNPPPTYIGLGNGQSLLLDLNDAVTKIIASLGVDSTGQRVVAGGAINDAFVSSFIALFNGLQNLPTTYLIAWFDPVDFVLTDSENRQVGYTQNLGQVNEVGNGVYFSGNGATEILVIPSALASIYHLQLVGAGGGSFLAGFDLVSPAGIQSTTIQSSLLKGDAILTLDFSPQNPTNAQTLGQNALDRTALAALLSQGAATIGALTNAAVAVNLSQQVVYATDAAAEIANLADPLQNDPTQGSGMPGVSVVVARINTLLQRVLGSIKLPFKDMFGRWDASRSGAQAQGASQMLDLFWAGLSHRILGLHGVDVRAFHLDEVFHRLNSPDGETSNQKPAAANPPDNSRSDVPAPQGREVNLLFDAKQPDVVPVPVQVAPERNAAVRIDGSPQLPRTVPDWWLAREVAYRNRAGRGTRASAAGAVPPSRPESARAPAPVAAADVE